MGAFLDQPQRVARLVDVIAVTRTKLAKGLDANRKETLGHGSAYTVLRNMANAKTLTPIHPRVLRDRR